MSLQVTQLEEGEPTPLHQTMVLLGNQAVEFFLVTLQELGRAELPLAVVYIALVRACNLVADQVTTQGALGLEGFIALVALEGAHLRVNLHVAAHVVLCGEELVAQEALDVAGPLHVHVLHMFVQVGAIVGGIVALVAVEQLGLVWEVGVVVNLQ